MFDLSRNFYLLKLIFHLRRLRGLMPRHNTAAHRAEQLRGEFYEQLWEDAAASGSSGFGYSVIQSVRGVDPPAERPQSK